MLKHLLESGHAFVRPDRILSDLEPGLAVQVLPGAVHSIAAHTAHMAWWQRQKIQDIETQAKARVRVSGEEFPQYIALEDWETVRQDFLDGLERLQSLCDHPEVLNRLYLERDTTVTDALLDIALHNAYHLGQIVLLRRLMGVWPPAGYDPEAW